ncbi:MAG: ABC transporter ATP-binding protein [Candidatus Methanofastidiosia archaeon]|jgi:ABC-2 type transport system ATP-binding protein
MSFITCKELTKTFKEKTVLDDISFNVEEGIRYGVLGPDNSGKTTLLKIITGMYRPTTGEVTLFDINVTAAPHKALEKTGCLVGEPSFYQNFTVQYNIELFAHLLDADSEKVIETTGITFTDAKVNTLTYDKKKILGIAVALLGDPDLLILDEPLAFSSPAVRDTIKNVLLSQSDVTILFTSTNPEDIKDMAQEAAILKSGKISNEGPVSELKEVLK